MATHRTHRAVADRRLVEYRQLRQQQRDFRVQLAVSQLASFLHLLCSELKVGWLSRSLILTWVAIRRDLATRRQSRRQGR
jgi:hypothetical protein